MTTITERDTIGRKLRAARALAGLDQQQVADAVGVSRTTASGWERGKFEPTFSAIVRWAKATNQPLDWFAEGLISESRARRDSNPQPSDWEYHQARTAFTRVLLTLSLCQLAIDVELHDNGVVQ